MSRVRIKICCVASAAEAELAGRAGADFIGLVGPMPSGPGIIDLPTARTISDAAPLWVRPILLTASATAEQIAQDAAQAGVDAVQVVRHIAAEEAAKLAEEGLRYLQVVHVEGADALELIAVYAPHCDGFLLDSGRPREDAFGGTGQRHDWRISADFVRRAPRPVFLAGGLNPGNIAEAIRAVRPFGVDICSGLRPRAALDPDLLGAFAAAVREASAAIAPGAGRADA